MTTPLTSAYLVSVGVLLMAAAHAALQARSSRHRTTNWLFALTCVAFACFQYFCAQQHVATDAVSALSAHRWLNVFSILVIPLIAMGAATLDSRRSPALLLTVCVLAGIALLYNFLSPYGYRFHELGPDKLITLPWGEQARLVQGEPSLIYRLTRLMSLIVLMYALKVTLGLRSLQERPVRQLLYIGLCIMAVTLALSSLTDSGLMALPYTGGFGFVFMAGAFALWIRQEMLTLTLHEKRITRALLQETRGRQLADARAEQILLNDELTGLLNRAGFNQHLSYLLEQNRQQGGRLALLLISIDNLGVVKGAHGIAASDELLQQMALRIGERIRESDVLAHTSSDGFSLIAPYMKHPNGVEVLCNKLRQVFDIPFEIGGKILRVNISMGLATHPADATTDSELIAAAELALHEARNAGASQFRAYHPAQRESMRARIDLESALRSALPRGQLYLCYQPQVCATSSRTLAMEALLRWQHPEHGLVPPLQFIPIAETNGQIIEIGAWVIETACKQLATWHRAGHAGLRMAVNLSVVQLQDPSLEQRLLESLNRWGLSPPDLELEITESVLIHKPEKAVQRFAALRKLGIRLSIDDFGTGYSSLNYLRVLPIQAFKLDRSFIEGLGKDETCLEICASTIHLAQNLGLDIVAEGVETEIQVQWLRTLGCPILQGYLFARPLNAAEASTHLLEQANRLQLPDMPSKLQQVPQSG